MILKSKLKRRFKSSILRGTGEAYLIIKQYPYIDFSKHITDSCLYNYAYDKQCEASRATYLFGLIELSKNQEKIRNSILEALILEDENTWSLTQLFDLARLYVQKSDKYAYNAIYERFNENIIDGASWIGASEIIEIDGLKGLLFIANKVGKYLAKHPDEWEDDFYISHFQRTYPGIDVYVELKKAACNNKNIDTYINCVQKTKIHWDETRKSRPIYKNIIEEIEEKNHFVLINRTLTKTEIVQVADKFICEKDKSKKAKYLSVFRWVKYPYDCNLLLSIAKGNSNNYRIKEYAIEALKHIQSNEIREFALIKIETTTQPSIYTGMFLSNYEEGDEVLLTYIVNKFKNEHIIESLARSYVDIYTKNKTQKCKLPLEALYNKMNCGIHRNAIIEILIENNVLSDELREEVQFDSDEDTRKLSNMN